MPNRGDSTTIAGSASIEHDFVGRDQTSTGQSVHIAMERIAEVSALETDQIRRLSEQIDRLSTEVTALTRALIGDQRYGSTGLVQQVKEMAETNVHRERWRQLSVGVLVLVATSQVAQWYLIWRIYVLYWAIVGAVG